MDAECAFLEGCCKVNFMQHMLSQTLKAQMAISSWDVTPLFSSLNAAIYIMKKQLDQCLMV